MIDVVVIGAGPNGLAAAVILARAGLGVRVLEAASTPGGGARTAPLGLADGVEHDLCSAVHPLAWASPLFQALDLEAHGVELLAPEVAYAQPFDDGTAAIAYRDLDETVDHLGRDGAAWRRVFAPLVDAVDDVVTLALGDKRSLGPLRPAGAWRAGTHLARSTLLVNAPRSALRLRGHAAALLAGVGTHANTRISSPAATATGLLLGTLAHTGKSWCIPRGGSQALSDALVADLVAHGGQITLDHRVSGACDLPAARVYIADTSPGAAAAIFAHRLSPRMVRALGAYRHGAGVAKVDFVLSGPVPWAAPDVGRASTVHLGGDRADIARTEFAVHRGRHPNRPVTLVSDPAVLDGRRVVGGLRPLWSYAHVPSGSDRDVTGAVTARIEAAAPGFRDLVVASRCVPAGRMNLANANYVGGDVLGGAVTIPQMIARPTGRPDPYRIGADIYLCSASTPPGPGVHGMGGMHAAARVLRHLHGPLRRSRPVL